ncbi:MAG TPA: IS1380 family transposase [Edaphobacter sp.]|uniref:IS1380 family transposase n=1 Tax=Edaphobacter sp. TaxID=1934404 RepID=UPI002C69B18F|nr:IS1380 family transposase [Edaphobacter sp.]HUZ95040.1 IS1380 family transposase [Edaphobacter sp.]
MQTQCNQESLEFHPLNQRQVVGRFDGGEITTDAGGLLLREVEQRTGIIARFAGCFRDHRAAGQVEHTARELVAQRIYALALGYEDLNDHDQLRRDPLLAVLAEKPDPTGESRARERDRGKALAGKSTLNRLELTAAVVKSEERYKKIALEMEAVDRLLVEIFLEAHATPPAEIVLDLDATDDPLHGQQEGRFFHGYYGCYCYLPLYVFCGDHLLCARLRPSNIDASAGCVEEAARIVAEIRQAWPEVRITLRGDSGFCREELMAWCEQEGVDYVLGLAKNERLKQEIVEEQEQAAAEFQATGQPARVFKEFFYQTRESWSRARRVIAKAEHLEKGSNPRFVVTSLGPEAWEARRLYEELYCARGEMENRIKEQLMLFADRTSTALLRSNQIRLYFSSMGYTLMEALRRLGLKQTDLAQAQAATIRLKLLKIGALIRITVRKVWVSLAGGYPYAELFAQTYAQLRAFPSPC